MGKYLISAAFVFFFSMSVSAQESDTTRVDTLKSVIIAPCDTCGLADTSAADTLSEAEKALEDFQKRRQKIQDTLLAPKPFISYFDSLTAHFTSRRFNYHDQVERSSYKDAGGYFRSDPSFFVLNYQSTPMRTTVQPFALSGDRMNVLIGSHSVHPFEHIIEPDGLLDFNDFPTALDHNIYILPGPAGAVFGGNQVVASMITLPEKPESFAPQSALLVDKGSFGYSYARARYQKEFVSGREMNLSLGYRLADGPFLYRNDDAYHYYADVFWPLSRSVAVKANGRLYDREGYLAVRPDAGGQAVQRSRIDRSADISLVYNNEQRTAGYELGFSHLRQASRLMRFYYGNFNYTGDGGHVSRTWFSGSKVIKAELTGNYLKYDDAYRKFTRLSSDVNFNLSSLSAGWRYALTAGGQFVEEFGFLPRLAGMLFTESDRFSAMFSLGYAERAPTLHELHLRFQTVALYGTSSLGYADEGNPDLLSEKQLVANADIQIGSVENSLSLSVTGGRIKDGIDWHHRLASNGTSAFTLFSPENGSINFLNTALTKKVKIADILHFKAGGAYHYIDYTTFADKAYSPDYQLFSGLELHIYWKQRLIHFFAYGELVYVGPYDGYVEKDLGNKPIVNATLSFKMRSFRFHWVIQNVFSTQYQERDYFLQPGRYNFFGFSWDFLN